MKPSILLTRKIPASVVSRLEAVCDVDRDESAGAISRDALIARLPGKQALLPTVTDQIDSAVIDAGRDLRVIANIGVGYNNIDVAAARERGIVVTNTPDVLTGATADFTWALILGITRRVGEGERLIRRGEWKGWALDQLLGMELRGRQLGIVGFGRIGRAVAERAAAFGMTVVYAMRPGADHRPDLSRGGPSPLDHTRGALTLRQAQGHPEPGQGVSESRRADAPEQSRPLAEPLPLDRLLSTSDIVSLHVPLAAGTRHLIDQPALARMKRTAYLINTTRGPVVDEAALVWALKSRLIAGAALDVYEREPEVHPDLLGFENVLLAPHLGSATLDTRTAMADLAARNVLAVLAGEPPLTPVP